LLYRDGAEVALGGRAFDILTMLVERAGEIVPQREITDRVWASLYVEEANLRVHIANLRKALRDGEGGVHYIQTVPRRGYCFVAAIDGERRQPPAALEPPASVSPGQLVPSPIRTLSSFLPPPLARMVGREADIASIVLSLKVDRFVSLVGTGGVGKTTAALAVANAMIGFFDGAVAFVDLGTLNQSDLVAATVAAAVGLVPQAENLLPGLMAFLRNKTLLIVFDNCEHVIDAVAQLAERLHQAAPGVFILATSREALRVEGESVYLLAPLGQPPDARSITAEEAMSWPAVQLFMERAAAGGHRVGMSDQDAPIVISICRRLDGIALAIELAAGRVAVHGIAGTAQLLDNRFKLLWQGRRSALPRQQTMLAMVDWSNNLLPEEDRRVLARLSIFVGAFSLDDAQGVLADADLSAMQVATSLASLTDKSLLSIPAGSSGGLWRLLEVTRSYAATKLEESGEYAMLARRHAHYWSAALVEREECRIPADTASVLGNLLAALDWSFSHPGNLSIGIPLSVRAAAVFRRHARLLECLGWCERALAALDDAAKGTVTELGLLEGFIVGAMFTQGSRRDVSGALQRALSIARSIASQEDELRLLSWLHIFLTRSGDFRAAMDVAERGAAIAGRLDHDGARVVADWMLGASCHVAGNQRTAEARCQAALERSARPAAETYLAAYGVGQRVRGLSILARTLWLRGHPEQAEATAARAVAEAEARQHPLAICIAYLYAATISVWRGDFTAASARVDYLIASATANSLAPFLAAGIGLRGEVAVLEGQRDAGIDDMRMSLTMLQESGYLILASSFRRALAEALAAEGAAEEAAQTLEQVFAQVEVSGEGFLLPDLYRARAVLQLHAGATDHASIEDDLLKSLHLAEQQGAAAWALRTTLQLADMRKKLAREDDAATLLREALAPFPIDLPDRDVRAGRELLASLDHHTGGTPSAHGDARSA
jgi:predicted ATPase/DNA-binding winged helix-turn-helix (wHTH) protein